MQAKPYFNDHQNLYQGCWPPWCDVVQIEGLDLLMRGMSVIKDELFANLAIPANAALCFKKHSLKRRQGWRQIELMIYGVSYPDRCEIFPQTMQLLRQIPGISTAYFSLLAPHTEIPAHTGDTDAYYRVHLGLKVPAALPDCGLQVAGESRPWQEGRCLAFTDIYSHTAWNHTGEERIVLILDVLRPEFRDRQMWVDAGMRATLYWSRLYEKAWPLIELMPRFLTRLGRPLFHWVAYGYFRLRGGVR